MVSTFTRNAMVISEINLLAFPETNMALFAYNWII
jgi:hypothetical protein